MTQTSPQEVKRKLAAILSADVQGYSRLMGEDEVDTIRTLEKYRDILSALVELHRGRVVDAPGDNVLAEFGSVVDAIESAVDIQKKLEIENAELPENRRMAFRIGINLGDVIEEGGRIYGNGVNIAARIEGLARAGGICISSTVHDQVKTKLNLGYEHGGEHSVKNIADPVRVYHVLMQPEVAGGTTGQNSVAAVQNGGNRQTVCIAVLPFENFSGHRDDDYFSRGVVEDLITDLAHFQSLQVISSYTSRKIGAEVRSAVDAARELAIDYLLKGNLRRTSSHVRITAQLLDASDGRIVWAERYDSPLDTIFEIQDEIVEQVVGAVSNQIDKALLAAARKRPLTSLAAYDCWLHGMDQIRLGTLEADLEARRIFKQALEIDPNYARAYAGLSLSHFNDWSCQLWEHYDETERRAYKYAVEANRLDDTDHVVQMILGRILLYRRQFDMAEQHFDRSLALNANDADLLAQISTSKAFLGKAPEGEQLFRKAMRLNPYRNIWYYPYGAFTCFVQRKYDSFIEMALKGPLTEVWLDMPAFLAAAYSHTDHPNKAAHYLNIFIDTFAQKITPGHRPEPPEIIQWMTKANPFKHEDDEHHMVQGIVSAGLGSQGGKKKPKVPKVDPDRTAVMEPNCFAKEGGQWKMAFGGRTVRIPEVKGFIDIARLMAEQGAELHCTVLMGIPDSHGQAEEVLDEKARRSYEDRIRDLQEEIREAQEMNDLGRTEKLNAELDQLVEHLSKSLGIGKRSRKFNSPSDRARAAVTWRIRSAIRKIEAVHSALGRHLANSIRTGTFCSYSPEKELTWHL
jgi:TolB-like protein/class 3 adenylate cyclase